MKRKDNSIELITTDNGKGIPSITINTHTIEVCNYGGDNIAGYEIGFLLDGIVLEQINTSSMDFKWITGVDILDDKGVAISAYALGKIKELSKKGKLKLN